MIPVSEDQRRLHLYYFSLTGLGRPLGQYQKLNRSNKGRLSLPFNGWLTEGAIAAAAVAILSVYHWRLWRRSRSSPAVTAMGRHRLVRAAWAEMVQAGHHDLLAVQTLRNWIVSATFLASTSILFALGILGAAFTTDKLSQFAHELNFLGSQDTQLWLFKALLLLINFMTAFFNFSLAIRAFIHTGFAINLTGEQEVAIGQGLADAELEQGAFHFTLGMRGYYLAIPLTLWLFGPMWMLVGSILLVLIFRRVD